MTLKKLTVAAMIAVGISACAFSNAMANCPCEELTPHSHVTGPAAPCETIKDDCGSKKHKKEKCNKCKRLKNDCKCKEEKKSDCGDPIEKKSDCNECPEISCDPPAQPACASCATPEKPTRKDMRQVYAYPNAIYGANNYVGDDSNSIYSAETQSLDRIGGLSNGTTITSEGSMTGAATQLPYLNENSCDRINGVPILRNEAMMDNNCPIQINTENSLDALKKTYTPFELNPDSKGITGAAADMLNFFPDVPQGYWAACEIDKLAMNDVVVGYPDRKFKPSKNVSRAEFATMLVKGFNMDSCSLDSKCIFSDVPESNWANPMIAKAVDENLMKGYPNNTFKPNSNVTRAEALCALSKGLNSELDECRAKEVLSQYRDGHKLPEWAQIPIATALDKGALSEMPNSNLINPDKKATRADIASMLQTIRVAAGYDKNPKTANSACPIDMSKQAYLENEEVVKIPTLQLKFSDEINAKSAHVGQRFAATTLEDVTINGVIYPCGSKVTGKVIEVIRPSGCQKGALKLSFTEIKNGDCKAQLPKQILTAQINKSKTPNPVARLVTMPFTWAGSLVGIVGRTTGGMLSNVGNAVENVSNGVGTAFGETFQGQFGAAGRSIADATVETVKAPVDFTRTALSGTMGLFQSTGDEVAYLVDAKGYKISAVNPKEHITIAFGCNP